MVENTSRWRKCNEADERNRRIERISHKCEYYEILGFLGLFKTLQAKVLCELRDSHSVLWRHKCRLQNVGRENALKKILVEKFSLSSFCLCSSYSPHTCLWLGWEDHNSRRHVGQNTLNIFKCPPWNAFFCGQYFVFIDKVWSYAVLHLYQNIAYRPWLWWYWALWRMLGGWNTRSPWAIFAPQTTITRFCIETKYN